MSWWLTLIITLSGNIAGGGLALLGALRAVKTSHENALNQQEKDRKEVAKRFRQAVHDEIETLWKVYQDGVGIELERLQDGSPLLVHYPVTQDPFTIYSSSGFLVGNVEDADLRKRIVQIYSKARSLIDSYKMNNEMLGKLESWTNLYRQTNNPLYEQDRQALLVAMQDYAKRMRVLHYELKELVEYLLPRLVNMGLISKGGN